MVYICRKYVIAIAILISPITIIATDSVTVDNKTITDGFKLYTWFNGDREEQVYVAMDEVAIFPKNVTEKINIMELIRSFDPQAALIKDYEFVVLIHIPSGLDMTILEDEIVKFQHKTGNKANLVFYRDPKKDNATMVLTGEIIVRFKEDWNETKVIEWSKVMGIDMIKSYSFSPNTYLFNVGSGIRSLETANKIYLSGQAIYAYPNWWKAMELKNDRISKENKTYDKKVPFISNIATAIILLIVYLNRRK